MCVLAVPDKIENVIYLVQLDKEDFIKFRNSELRPKLCNGLIYITKSGQYLHRLITKAKKGEEVDHKNGHTLDCRRSNLRIVTHRQNMLNTKSRIGSTSKFKGVHWHKELGKWRAMISVNGKSFHLGVFNSEIEAAKCYDKHAKQLFGEFARLNFLK